MNTRNLVKVWDPFVRTFHWSLVFLFALAYLTGDESEDLHVWAGYIVLVLIGLRIGWGLIGSKHARFSDFVRSPVQALKYLQALIKGKAPRSLGHNPAAGWMIIMLLGSILMTGFSGVMLLGAEGEGPMAAYMSESQWLAKTEAAFSEHEKEHADDDDDHEYGEVSHSSRGEDDEAMEAAEEFWEDIHEFFANFTVLLVIVHIGGVIMSSRAHGENLAKAMVTGWKRGA